MCFLFCFYFPLLRCFPSYFRSFVCLPCAIVLSDSSENVCGLVGEKGREGGKTERWKRKWVGVGQIKRLLKRHSISFSSFLLLCVCVCVWYVYDLYLLFSPFISALFSIKKFDCFFVVLVFLCVFFHIGYTCPEAHCWPISPLSLLLSSIIWYSHY